MDRGQAIAARDQAAGTLAREEANLNLAGGRT